MRQYGTAKAAEAAEAVPFLLQTLRCECTEWLLYAVKCETLT